jgi:hypothetical protein
MERNLYILKGVPFRPGRICEKTTGDPRKYRTASEVHAKTGKRNANRIKEASKSKRRLLILAFVCDFQSRWIQGPFQPSNNLCDKADSWLKK